MNQVKTKSDIKFDYVVSAIPRFNESERETIEVLLDEEFTKTILKRGKELDRLREEGKLLSLTELQEEFR